jgi:hypothetical protein
MPPPTVCSKDHWRKRCLPRDSALQPSGDLTEEESVDNLLPTEYLLAKCFFDLSFNGSLQAEVAVGGK